MTSQAQKTIELSRNDIQLVDQELNKLDDFVSQQSIVFPISSGARPVSKRLAGLTPGGPVPGAFAIQGRASGAIPVWMRRRYEQSESDTDEGAEQGNENTEQNRTYEVHNEQSPGQQSTDDDKIPFYCKRKFFLFFSMTIIAVIVIATIVPLSWKHRMNDSVSETKDYISCSALNGQQPNILTQCKCFGTIQIMSNEGWRNYGLLMDRLQLHTLKENPTTSCDHENVALLLLTSMNITSMSTDQLLVQYVMNLLYLSWNGASWAQQNGCLFANSGNVCNCNEVTCESGQVVTAFNVSGKNIEGSILSELGLLNSLTSLDLSGNKLTGTVPSEIGNLVDLTTFSIFNNKLTGTLPTELSRLNNLVHILVSFNGFNGSLPFWSASGLSIFHASDCDFIGSIPPIQLGAMRNLTLLNLENNLLTGSIPTEIGLLRNLQYLILSVNYISGILPSSIGNCSALCIVTMHYNNLSGSIPNDTLGNLRNLEVLQLGNNQLSGLLSSDGTSAGLCELRQTGKLKVLETDCQSKVTCEICCISFDDSNGACKYPCLDTCCTECFN